MKLKPEIIKQLNLQLKKFLNVKLNIRAKWTETGITVNRMELQLTIL